MERWYVVNTKPKKEDHVERLFREGGIAVYAPKVRVEGRSRPFFPGYQFVFLDYPDQYRLVKFTRGVKRLVGNEAGPIPIESGILDRIREREVDGFVELEKYGAEPEPGDPIEVAEGPLKGFRGVFSKSLSEQDRVLILLNYVSYQGQLLIERKKLRRVGA